MTMLVHVTDVTEEVYPTITQTPEVMAEGQMTRDELEAMLPKDAQLQEGHYDISGDVAKWLGFELPEGLLD
jgi:hypothetical protein